MPIVKVLGEELQPYDEERRAEGMVRPMREPGQGFNVMVSKMIELIGLTPIPPLMTAEGQVEVLRAVVYRGEHAHAAVSALQAGRSAKVGRRHRRSRRRARRRSAPSLPRSACSMRRCSPRRS